MSIKQHKPLHPGEFIKRVYMEPYQLSSAQIAKNLAVSPSTFNRLVNAKSDVSPDMALRLSRVIGRSAESWLLMQDNYDLHKASRSLNLNKLKAIDFAATTPCVLFVHDMTRFPLFMPALEKNDFAELDYWFIGSFMNTC